MAAVKKVYDKTVGLVQVQVQVITRGKTELNSALTISSKKDKTDLYNNGRTQQYQ